jgi:lysozyme family protein
VKENFEYCFQQVLKHEGGYVNHPKDPGGMTNLGVTKRSWETWVKREVTEQEMRGLTAELVREFYKVMYWDKCRCDELPSGVDYSVFDFGVNAGPRRSIITLQRSVGVKDDGIFGPMTMKAVLEAPPKKIVGDYFSARMNFYRQLQTFETFGKGWGKRASDVMVGSAELIKKAEESQAKSDSSDSSSGGSDDASSAANAK